MSLLHTLVENVELQRAVRVQSETYHMPVTAEAFSQAHDPEADPAQGPAKDLAPEQAQLLFVFRVPREPSEATRRSLCEAVLLQLTIFASSTATFVRQYALSDDGRLQAILCEIRADRKRPIRL